MAKAWIDLALSGALSGAADEKPIYLHKLEKYLLSDYRSSSSAFTLRCSWRHQSVRDAVFRQEMSFPQLRDEDITLHISE
jgi:hypothetical protein